MSKLDEQPPIGRSALEPDVVAASVLSDQHVGLRVIRGGAQRVVGLVIANLLTAGSAVVLLRYLGVSDFGRYGTVLALVGVVYGISDMGLTITATRELTLCENAAQRRELLAHVLGLRILVTSLGVVVAVAFALAAGYARPELVGTALAGLGTILQSVQAALLLPLGVQLRNGALALNQVLTQAVLLAGFLTLAVAGAGLVLFFAVQVLVGLALLAVVPAMLSRNDLVTPAWTPSRLRSLAKVGVPVAVATVLGVLYLRILVIVMSLVSGDVRQLGYYVTSTRVLDLIGGLPFLVVALVLPVLTVAARDNHARLVYMTAQVAQAMALLGVVIALVLWTLSDQILTVLGGSAYGPAGAVLSIQGFATITIFVTAAWQPALIAMNRMRSLMISMGAGVLVVIAAGLILIPKLQARGAAIAAVLGDVTLCAMVFGALWRAGPMRWISPQAVIRIAAAAGAAVAFGLIPGIEVVARAAMVVAVFTALAVAFGAVPAELHSAVRSIFGRVSGSVRR